MEARYQSFQEFYPFYLSEHSKTSTRVLHFIGTLLVFLILVMAVCLRTWTWLWYMPLAGYGFAWVAHFFFEKNKPATFRYPLYSLTGDFVMFWQLLIGKIQF